MTRTVLDLDGRLMAKARHLAHLSRTSDIVSYALAELIKQHERLRILELQRKVRWKGNLDAMRSARRS